jgi:hypothetical protein
MLRSNLVARPAQYFKKQPASDDFVFLSKLIHFEKWGCKSWEVRGGLRIRIVEKSVCQLNVLISKEAKTNKKSFQIRDVQAESEIWSQSYDFWIYNYNTSVVAG